MAFIRFIVGLLGLALLVVGTVYGILGFWGVSKGTDDGWRLALMGIGAVILGGIFLIRPSRG
jgi:ABC-type transport system involved in multi-copper enzyme maturation permease subunit